MKDALLLVPKTTRDAIPQEILDRCAAPEIGLAPGALLSPRLALGLARDPKNAASCILIADLRCAAAISHLREHGFVVERAGNRVFGGDASPAEVAALCGDTLYEQLVALAGVAGQESGARDSSQEKRCQLEAWSRDGWAGLSTLGIGWQHAIGLLQGRRVINRIGDAKAAAGACRELDDLIIAAVEDGGDASLGERLRITQDPKWSGGGGTGAPCQLPCPAELDLMDYEQARCLGQPVDRKPVLVLYQRGGAAGAGNTVAVEYICQRDKTDWLARLICDSRLHTRFDLELILGHHRCRLLVRPRQGAAASDIDVFVSRLFEVALVTGRPVRDFSCTLYLPLDLHLDEELLSPAESMPHRLMASMNGREEVEPHTVEGPAAAACRLGRILDETSDEGKRLLRCQLSRARWGGSADDAEKLAEAQALLYFLPALRERIFDIGKDTFQSGDSPETIRHWCLRAEQLEGAALRLEMPVAEAAEADDKRVVDAAVEAVSLYGYKNNLFILAIRLGLRHEQQRHARCFAGQGPDWWHGLLGWAVDPGAGWSDLEQDETCRQPDPHELQVERWLALVKGTRLLRPAFAEQGIERKLGKLTLTCAHESHSFQHEPLSPIVIALLKQLTGIDFDDAKHRDRLLQIRDDRMVVNAAYALAGPSPGPDPAAQDAFQRLFGLALFVDRGKDGFASQGGYAYDRGFVETRLEQCVNRRWQGVGSLYGSTNYSHVAVGFGDYFAGPVTRVHLPHIHGRMLLLVLFHELTLGYFNRCITEVTREIEGLDRQDPATRPDRLQHAGEIASDFQRRFIRFTNDHWYREVTSQTQGTETYDLLNRVFALEEKYALVKDKIERSNDYIVQQRDRLATEQSLRQSEQGVALSEQGVIQTRKATELADTANTLSRRAVEAGKWALRLALVALLIGVLAIPSHDPNPSFSQFVSLAWEKLLHFELGAVLRANWNFIVAALVLLIVVVVVVWRWKTPKSKEKKT